MARKGKNSMKRGKKARAADGRHTGRMAKRTGSLSSAVRTRAVNERVWLSAYKIAEYERHQRIMWAWAVAGAILVFFLLLVIEGGALGGLWPFQSQAEAALLEEANYIAVLVIALDLAGRWKASANKLLFVRQNWLAILTLVPMGLLVRVGGALESLSLLRNVQLFAKAEEIAIFAPIAGTFKAVHIAYYGERASAAAGEVLLLASRAATDFHKAVSSFATASDFAGFVSSTIGKLLRIR